jgi:hypothetical protein
MQPENPTVPPDDPRRNLVLARPNDDEALPHVGVVGDTYTILLTGEDTAGRYCLIDMLVPAGVLLRIATISKRRSRFLTERSRLPFAVPNRFCEPARPLTFHRTRRISSTTPLTDQHACCVCAHRQGRKSFLWLSVSRSRRGQRPPLNSIRPPRRRSKRKQKRSPASTEQNCYKVNANDRNQAMLADGRQKIEDYSRGWPHQR